MNILISLENVTKVYRMGKVDIEALRGVSLNIEQGEMISIIGASGSGKSTLMNIMGFLDTPTTGIYTFNGTDVGKLNDNRLAVMRSSEIGFVFQDYNLLSRSTAIANVELPMVYSGGPHKRERALEALGRVGLAARADHKPTELSGGEQQRVAIARALINRPQLLLADEPTGNLDTRATGEIMDIFHQLNSDGITVVMITHEMDIAAMAKRTIRIMDGQIISDGEAATTAR